MDALLQVTGLTVTANHRPLVQDVGFTLAAGERLGIIGASGSGKTVTCLAVAGLLGNGLRARGSIRLDGHPGDLVQAGEREWATIRGLRTGMVFQEPMTALNPTMRVGRQVAEVITRHRRQDRRTAAATAVDLLADTGLADPVRVAASYPHQLSGGQRQRVVLAIALANGPDLLICDEPTTALDVTVQARVLDLINRKVSESAAALLFISHDLAVVAAVCDRVLVMHQGRIVESGPVVQVLTDPQHPHTRELLAHADVARRAGSDG